VYGDVVLEKRGGVYLGGVGFLLFYSVSFFFWVCSCLSWIHWGLVSFIYLVISIWLFSSVSIVFGLGVFFMPCFSWLHLVTTICKWSFRAYVVSLSSAIRFHARRSFSISLAFCFFSFLLILVKSFFSYLKVSFYFLFSFSLLFPLLLLVLSFRLVSLFSFFLCFYLFLLFPFFTFFSFTSCRLGHYM